MNRLLAWTLAAALWPVAGLAMPATELEPSAVRACLQPAEAERGVPEYPFDLYKRKVSGRVKATVTFPGGFFGPDVSIDEHHGDEGFAKPVREYLRKLKAPCIAPGSSARLQFDFHFVPDEELVRIGEPVDPQDATRQRMAACMTHGDLTPTPTYPMRALREGRQGRVLLRLTFNDPSNPPTVQMLHRESAESLAQAVSHWAAGLRLPCFEGSSPLTFRQLHVFVIEGGTYGFKPVALPRLMGMVKGVERQRIQWNTHDMGCPFQLRVTYLQPQARNGVREVGERDPRRAPLLDWLARAEISGKSALLDAIFADTADVTVPCARFDLNPKE